MKQSSIKPFLNWRTHALLIISALALILIMGECDDMGYLLFTKGLGFGLAYIIYRLGKYWAGKGKINELIELINEEY